MRNAALDPRDYEIAFIAPLEIEYVAIFHMLDKVHDGQFLVARGDDYIYTPGEMFGNNVIIATLPAGTLYGTTSAAALASQVKKFFPCLWFGLLVGVAAGLPRLKGTMQHRDIRLGDVLVALPVDDKPALINYELGKETAEGFQLLRDGRMPDTETIVRSAIRNIKMQGPQQVSLLQNYYAKIKGEVYDSKTFVDPGQENDHLYELDESGVRRLVTRENRPSEMRTRVWYGTIGSGNTVMKNAAKRDILRDEHDLIGLEMEAAGIQNNIPVGIIRGVCDYGDEQKHKEWQPYAAAMAAAYAKLIVSRMGPSKKDKRVHYLPHSKNLSFTGREEYISTIHQKLFFLDIERVALAGLGGMGKTQIALELSHQVKDSMEKYSVFWMPAQSMEVFQKTARELVELLHIPHNDKANPAKILKEHLSSDAAGFWFLVVDNIDDMSVVDGIPGDTIGLLDSLPKSPKGRILFTTRTLAVAHTIVDSQNVVQLEQMTLKEGRRILETCLANTLELQKDDADENVALLLEELAYLPLTIMQAVKYMNMNQASIIQYLALLRTADGAMLTVLSKDFRDETFHSRSQGAVATTWIISFTAICNSDAVAAQLLSFIRWMGPKAIPQSMLPRPDSDSKDGFATTNAIGLLCSYGFLTWQKDGQTLDMHRLVHLALKACPAELFTKFMTQEDAIWHLRDIYPKAVRWENKALQQQYFQHAFPIATSPIVQHCVAAALLVVEVIPWLLDDFRSKQAIALCQSVVGFHSPNTGDIDFLWHRAQHELASSYEADGQHDKAISILEYTTGLDNNYLKEASKCLLAGVYNSTNKHKKAITIWEGLEQDAQKRGLNHDDPSRLSNQEALASAYIRNGQPRKAVNVLKDAARRQTKRQPQDSKTYYTRTLFARAYLSNGQVKEAIELLQELVSPQRNVLPFSHPERLSSQRLLAEAYIRNNQIHLAEGLLKLVVEIHPPAVEAHDVMFLHCQVDLVRVYQQTGEHEEANPLLEHIMDMQELIRGKREV